MGGQSATPPRLYRPTIIHSLHSSIPPLIQSLPHSAEQRPQLFEHRRGILEDVVRRVGPERVAAGARLAPPHLVLLPGIARAVGPVTEKPDAGPAVPPAAGDARGGPRPGGVR